MEGYLEGVKTNTNNRIQIRPLINTKEKKERANLNISNRRLLLKFSPRILSEHPRKTHEQTCGSVVGSLGGAPPIRPEAARLFIGIECSRVRDSAWMNLNSFVTT